MEDGRIETRSDLTLGIIKINTRLLILLLLLLVLL